MDNTYTDGWIGIDEAAKYMDVTKDTVRNWIKKTIFKLSQCICNKINETSNYDYYNRRFKIHSHSNQ